MPEGAREAWPGRDGVVCYECCRRLWREAAERFGATLKALDLPPAEYHAARSIGEHVLLKAIWEWQDASHSIRRHLDPATVSAALAYAAGVAEAVCRKAGRATRGCEAHSLSVAGNLEARDDARTRGRAEGACPGRA